MKKYKYLILLLLFFTVYNLFFMNKAFHIDDYFTVLISKEISNQLFGKPLHSYSELYGPTFITHNPLLIGFYYAPIIKLFGEKEAVFHLFYLPFTLLAITSMFFLSLRFADRSLYPTLFLIVSPAFIITSHSIMLDIPFLSFFLCSLLTFIYGIDKKNKSLLLLSSILITVTILFKYYGFILIPILVIYAFVYRRKQYCLYLFIPIFLFLLWNFYNNLFYSQPLFPFSLSKYRTQLIFNDIFERLIACLSFTASASIINILIIPFLVKRKSNKISFLLSLCIGILPFIDNGVLNKYSLAEKTILSFFLISSFYIIISLLKIGFINRANRRDKKDNFFLASWFFIMLVFILSSTFIAARFILLLLPPISLFIYRELNYFYKNLMGLKVSLPFFLIIVFFLSTTLAIGDYRFANIYRDITSYIKSKHYYQKNKFYFPLADWGYNYYIFQSGYRFLYNKKYKFLSSKLFLKINLDNMKKEKFIFVVIPKKQPLPYFEYRKNLLEKFSRLGCRIILIDQVDYFGNIFLHNKKYHVGFYSHDWGYFPFKTFLRKHEKEKFKIYKVLCNRMK